jgi:hypothetical protein
MELICLPDHSLVSFCGMNLNAVNSTFPNSFFIGFLNHPIQEAPKKVSIADL